MINKRPEEEVIKLRGRIANKWRAVINRQPGTRLVQKAHIHCTLVG